MRRLLIVASLALAASSLVVADGQVAATGRANPMLTVDSIMRGPKLVGTPPSAVQWAADSSKVYFSWQKAGDERPSCSEADAAAS